MQGQGQRYSEREAALIHLMRESLERGHWRVACRRYLMLIAAGGRPAPDLVTICETLLTRVDPKQLRDMRSSAEDWAVMVRASGSQVRAPAGVQPSRIALSLTSPFRASWGVSASS